MPYPPYLPYAVHMFVFVFVFVCVPHIEVASRLLNQSIIFHTVMDISNLSIIMSIIIESVEGGGTLYFVVQTDFLCV